MPDIYSNDVGRPANQTSYTFLFQMRGHSQKLLLTLSLKIELTLWIQTRVHKYGWVYGYAPYEPLLTCTKLCCLFARLGRTFSALFSNQRIFL